MSTGTTSANIVRLMTTFDMEIEMPPENNLKCEECGSVLKDAYQVPCGCRFCRTCIDSVISSGAQFCPGGSQECGETLLSTSLQDYNANKSISRLTAKCPLVGCSHECPLADMEGHLLVCRRKSVDCPFRQLGCLQDEMTAEEIIVHLHQETLSHSEILIGIITNINRDMEIMKRDNEKSKVETYDLKNELKLKDDQMRTVMDEMRHIQNEIKSIKDENKSIKDENKLIKEEIKSVNDENKLIKDEIDSMKREKEIIFNQLKEFSEKLELEMGERRESDEQNSARITAITRTVGSNQKELRTEIEVIKDDIRSIKQDNIKSMKGDIESLKGQFQSKQIGQKLNYNVQPPVLVKTSTLGRLSELPNSQSNMFDSLNIRSHSTRNFESPKK